MVTAAVVTMMRARDLAVIGTSLNRLWHCCVIIDTYMMEIYKNQFFFSSHLSRVSEASLTIHRGVT